MGNKSKGPGGSGGRALGSSVGLRVVEIRIHRRVPSRAVTGSDLCFNNIPLASKEEVRSEAGNLPRGYCND